MSRRQPKRQRLPKDLSRVVIHQSPIPATVFPKSITTPSLVAHMIAMKFQHGLPLTRVSSLLESWRITLNRRTIGDWMMQASKVLEPVFGLIFATP